PCGGGKQGGRRAGAPRWRRGCRDAQRAGWHAPARGGGERERGDDPAAARRRRGSAGRVEDGRDGAGGGPGVQERAGRRLAGAGGRETLEHLSFRAAARATTWARLG